MCVTRYGNVMASRGSVLPLFVEQIRNGQPITVTDPEMTRFMMTLDNAVDLVRAGVEILGGSGGGGKPGFAQGGGPDATKADAALAAVRALLLV